VVLAHGFGQDRHCWGPMVSHLSERYEVMAVDLPGHGEAPRLRASLPAAARLLADTGGRGAYVGYSMGARHALRVAIDRPDDVDRLVLISGTPGIADHHEAKERAERDELLAARIESDGVASFVDEWLDQPMFLGLPPEHRFEEIRRAADAVGLATSLRLAGTGAMPSMWDRLRRFPRPVLAVVGEHDARYVGIADRMSEVLPSAEVMIVPDAGHAPHLEQPDAVLAAVSVFLAPLLGRATPSSWTR